MKRILLLLAVFPMVALNILPTKTVLADSVQYRSEKFLNKVSKFNQALNKKLYKQIKSADSPTSIEQRGQHLNHSWFTFINKINYLKNDQLEIYVNDDFKKLSDDKRAQVVDFVQQLTLANLDKIKGVNPITYNQGLSSAVFCDGKFLGRTLFLDHKNFLWND